MNISETAILYLNTSEGTGSNPLFSWKRRSNTLEPTTPYGPSYDRGARYAHSLAHFQVCGLISVQGRRPNPHCCFNLGFKMARRHKDALLSVLFARYHPSRLFYSKSELKAGWHLPVLGHSFKRACRMSSEPLPKTSSPMLFGGGWTAAKSVCFSSK